MKYAGTRENAFTAHGQARLTADRGLRRGLRLSELHSLRALGDPAVAHKVSTALSVYNISAVH